MTTRSSMDTPENLISCLPPCPIQAFHSPYPHSEQVEHIREWSSITGRGGGGATNYWRGEQVKFYPCKKGVGGGGVFAILEVGPSMVVLIWVLEVLTILEEGGGHKRFPPFQRVGGVHILPCLERLAIYHFYSPPSP